MKWMKERDLLIAQTMAFVQSVKGKLPDAGMPTPAQAAVQQAPVQQGPAPSAAVAQAAPAAATETKTTVETKPALGIKPAAETPSVVMLPPLPVRTVIEGLPRRRRP